MEDDFRRHRLNDASHYYDPARDMDLNPSVANATTRVVTGAAKGTFKLVAFILNLFVPGLGTLFVGRIGTAIIQLLLIPIGIVLIMFGGVGVPILVADWVWGLLTVVHAWRKPSVVYVIKEPRR
mgnify:FL=1|tara:strand:- start:939 stop:1310 length:372 start_codon:yes stop_codon:yes gene_type:complete